jgi:hypothetical protein
MEVTEGSSISSGDSDDLLLLQSFKLLYIWRTEEFDVVENFG